MSDFIHLTGRSLSAPMLFSSLPEDEREALANAATAQRFGEGAIIQQRGETAEGFYLIEQGSVAVGQFLANGEFRGVALLRAGDSWGELAMFANRPRVVDAVARTTCTVRYISSFAFTRVLSDRPEIMHGLLSALSAQLQELLNVVAGIRRGSAQPRVAAMLNTLSNGMELPATIAVTQQELGELLGLTRATVNGALAELEKAGVIARQYGAIEILSRSKLDDAIMEA